MPQIDFFVLGQLSSLLLIMVLVMVFLLLHHTLLKQWLDSAIRISNVVMLVNEARIIKILVREVSFVVFLAGDFLEQFIIFLFMAGLAAFALYFYITFCIVLFSDFASVFFFGSLKECSFLILYVRVAFLKEIRSLFFKLLYYHIYF